jgi:uncharacterized protein YndB with AHSA1/START domain
MAAIVESVEIDRRPEDVFAYMLDPSNLPKWQESAVAARRLDDAPVAVGSRVVVTRRVGNRNREMTNELTELSPPTSWTVRGTDTPIRATAKGRIEPVGNGERSRVTIELDFKGRGIGMLLVPLVVRRQASAEMPRNMQKLKENLEAGT